MKNVAALIYLFLILPLMMASAAFAQSEAALSIREINIRPWIDFVNESRWILEKGDVDMASPFVLEFEGKMGPDGKLDPRTSKFIKKEGEPNLLSIAHLSIEAANDSGYFRYASDLDVTDIKVVIGQDNSDAFITMYLHAATETRARSMESALGLMIEAVRQKYNRKDASESQSDD